MRTLWLPPILAIAALARPSQGAAKPNGQFENLVHEYGYDRSAPLGIRAGGRGDRDQWLAERLKLSPIDLAAAARIPELK